MRTQPSRPARPTPDAPLPDETRRAIAPATGTTPTQAASLAALIRHDIIRGTLAPGARLKIRDLCERYDAGAIPLREALSRLATSGFVVAQDQRGFRVALVSAGDLTDITEARVHVECEALRRSIAHADLDWEERLIAAHYRMSRLPITAAGGGLEDAWEAAHAAFHSALIQRCDSQWLVRMAELLRDQTARYRHLSVATPRPGNRIEPGRDVPREHREILEAALARQADRAAGLLEAHLRATTRIVLAIDADAQQGPSAGRSRRGRQPGRDARN